MASRFARQLIPAAGRAGLRAKPSPRFTPKRWNSTSHGQEKSSDLPWVFGSGLVFGPALLYLLSPSSRKSAPHVAHGHDAHPAKPVVIKDDEGTPADVTAEVNAAIAEDAPKADGAEVKAAEPAEPVEEQAPTPAASEESATEESAAPSEEPSTPPVPEKVEEQSSSDDAKETDAPKKADA